MVQQEPTAQELKNELDDVKGKKDKDDITEPNKELELADPNADPNTDTSIERTVEVVSRGGNIYRKVTQYELIGNEADRKETSAEAFRTALIGDRKKLDAEPKI